MAKVVVLRTSPETVLEDIDRAFQLAEIDREFSREAPTIIKPNISWHFLYPSSNTTPWQFEGAVLSLQKKGYKELSVVENNTVVTNPYKGEKLLKFDRVIEKYNLPVYYNFKDLKWVRYEPKGELIILPRIYKKGIYIPEFFFGKNIIHLPTVKTHIYSTTTGSMKNAFGGLLNTKRHYTHTWIHETLVDLLTIQKEIHTGIFTLMDGTHIGCGPGPRTLEPHEADLILASSDSVAIDAVASKLLGFDPLSIKYIRLAHEKGLGTGDIKEIEIVGEDIEEINYHCKVGDNLASIVGDILWFGPLKGIQWLFFHTPLVYLFVFGSYFFHDLIWYPAKGKKVARDYLEHSKWGNLFNKY